MAQPNIDSTISPTELWKLYIDSGDHLRELTDKVLKKNTGIRLVDYKLLQLLVESPDAINHGEVRMGILASKLRISPSRLTYQVNSLALQSLVNKSKIENDKRGMAVSITDQGYQLYAKAYKVYFSVIGDIALKEITPEEAHMLKRVYKRVITSTARYEEQLFKKGSGSSL